MILPQKEPRVGAGGVGGAPQWVAGAQKAGALVYNAGYVYRVKQDIANGTAAPTATNQYYLQLPSSEDLDALDQRKPYLGITAQGSKGFDTLADVDASGARTVIFNAQYSTLVESFAPGDGLLLGQGCTLTVPTGLFVELSDSGIAGRPGTIIRDLNMVASGTGRLRVTCSGNALDVATAPRLEGGIDKAPIRYESTVPGALTVINKAVGNITNQSSNPDFLFTVYKFGTSTTGTIGANVKVVEVGGSGTPGTARDPLAIGDNLTLTAAVMRATWQDGDLTAYASGDDQNAAAPPAVSGQHSSILVGTADVVTEDEFNGKDANGITWVHRYGRRTNGSSGWTRLRKAGPVLATSPSGTNWLIGVTDSGNLVTTQV